MDNKTKKLRDLWYKKLKKSGFDDIETHDGKYLKYWDSHYFQNRKRQMGHRPGMTKPKPGGHNYGEDVPLSAAHYLSTQEYFYRAEHFLTEYAFKGATWARDKRFWKLHAEGKSNREIARTCKVDKSMVNKIINRLKKEFLSWKS